MKLKMILLVVSMGMPAALLGRQFTAADSNRKIEAEFVKYDKATDHVTLQTANGSNITSTSDKFCKEDRQYFVKAHLEANQRASIKLDVKSKNENDKLVGKSVTYSNKTTQYSFEISNSSGSAFKNLELIYWVVIERNQSSKRKTDVVKGTLALASLDAQDNTVIQGPVVKLKEGAACRTSCPISEARAAAVGKDRIVGSKVVIRDDAGHTLVTEITSKYIESLISSGES